MAIKIKKQLVSRAIINELTYGKGNRLTHIVIHETANYNEGANAQVHANLQSNGNSRDASWHYQVDDKQIIQSFPDNIRCWHAGSDYNNFSIGIEICVNKDGDYKKAVENAAALVKYLLKKHKSLDKDRVVTHHIASGWKDCPHYLRSGAKGIGWNDFARAITDSNGKVKIIKSTKPKSTPKSSGKLGLVDWMASKGMDYSQDNRKKLAAEYGIKGYDLSAEKNIELLNALKKGKPTTNKKAKVKKGAKVTLSKSATNYATGEKIPARVKGKKYTVQQVKKNRVLLKEIYSWVKTKDVTVAGAASGTPKKKKPSSGGGKYGYLQIVNVNNAAIMMDKPDRINGKNIGTIPKGTKVPLQGSVRGSNNPGGYWEVKYNGKLGYITAKYGKTSLTEFYRAITISPFT